ncbi:MAG TPA: PRC-barrel domain-containing protein [Patescibacteria group bacterium]|nr:PRC-barrel domain-containing protein [Patescibacteria group bacterium]
MALASDKNILGLRVITKMGASVGKVRHIIIDTDTLELANIEVAPSNIAKALVRGSLLIPKSGIVSINEKCVVVHDAVISPKEHAPVSSPVIVGD